MLESVQKNKRNAKIENLQYELPEIKPVTKNKNMFNVELFKNKENEKDIPKLRCFVFN